MLKMFWMKSSGNSVLASETIALLLFHVNHRLLFLFFIDGCKCFT